MICVTKKRQTAGNCLNVLSMFSGCGGMDLGFHEAGFKIIWANDMNEDCAMTYRENFKRITGNDNFVEGNIAKIEKPCLNKKTRVDVLLGGFPCQAYSNAGQRNGLNDERGRLYEYCLSYIKHFRPRFTVFENVRGFLSIHGKSKKLFEEIGEALNTLGYEVHVSLVNAADYGVPQNRLRAVMVGKRRDIHYPYYFPQKKTGMDLTLKTILTVPQNLPNQDDVIRLNPQAYKIGALVPEGGSWKSIPYKKLPQRLKHIRQNIRRYRWPNFYRRFSRHEVSGTVTAAFKPENAGVWHPIEKRTFSAREIARIQSFPDSFVFVSRTVKGIYQMIGNAVPPKMAHAFAESIIACLQGSAEPQPTIPFSCLPRTKPIKPGSAVIVFK